MPFKTTVSTLLIVLFSVSCLFANDTKPTVESLQKRIAFLEERNAEMSNTIDIANILTAQLLDLNVKYMSRHPYGQYTLYELYVRSPKEAHSMIYRFIYETALAHANPNTRADAFKSLQRIHCSADHYKAFKENVIEHIPQIKDRKLKTLAISTFLSLGNETLAKKRGILAEYGLESYFFAATGPARLSSKDQIWLFDFCVDLKEPIADRRLAFDALQQQSFCYASSVVICYCQTDHDFITAHTPMILDAIAYVPHSHPSEELRRFLKSYVSNLKEINKISVGLSKKPRSSSGKSAPDAVKSVIEFGLKQLYTVSSK